MIIIGDKHLSLKDVSKVLLDKEAIQLHEQAIERVGRSYNFLKDFSKDKLIYGINTGFGPMAQYRIDEENQTQLQYNLIRSHCSGTNNHLSPHYTKAVMLARLNSLIKGFSGIHPDAVKLLQELINRNISPLIFEHGGVGASGDLVQLAHLALVLIGEGEAYFDGKWHNTSELYASQKLQPLKIYIREGLGIMNGTSAMTGIGLLNLLYAYRLVEWCIVASSMINEIVESFDDHFSKELNQVKMHAGQLKIAMHMNEMVKGSALVRKREQHLYNRKIEDTVLVDKVQEYYSLRCVPQILGAIYDTVAGCENVLINELNSANDNPIIDAENKNIFHGGNFHGDYVSLEMDKLKIAVVKLSMLAERQLNYLLNTKLNDKLPPFVNLGKLGLNFGMQGVQFTATSTVAENQTLSFPMYVHSIPNNNDNQDIVSMGTNSALLTKKVVENTFEVLSIEFITLIQAVDYLGFAERLAPATRKIYSELRRIVPKFESDSPKYKEVRAVKTYLIDNKANIF
ncbi:MAG: histidine ammonia-lyase [Cytophagaceae bacterium]